MLKKFLALGGNKKIGGIKYVQTFFRKCFYSSFTYLISCVG